MKTAANQVQCEKALQLDARFSPIDTKKCQIYQFIGYILGCSDKAAVDFKTGNPS